MTVSYKTSTPYQPRVSLRRAFNIQFHLAHRGFYPTNSNNRSCPGICMIQNTIPEFINLSLNNFKQILRGLGGLKQHFIPTGPQVPNAKEKELSSGITLPLCQHIAASVHFNPIHYFHTKSVVNFIRSIGLSPKNSSCHAIP